MMAFIPYVDRGYILKQQRQQQKVSTHRRLTCFKGTN